MNLEVSRSGHSVQDQFVIAGFMISSPRFTTSRGRCRQHGSRFCLAATDLHKHFLGWDESVEAIELKSHSEDGIDPPLAACAHAHH